jgi:hypothetical protein
MIRLKQINNEHVGAVPKIGGEDTRPVKGAELFSEVYANIFLSAKKKSGKTSTVWKILQKCVGRPVDTRLIFFCSTLYKDSSWIFMRKYFESKGYDIDIHTSIKEDGVDMIRELVEELNEEARLREEEDDEEEDEVEREKQKGGKFVKDFLEYHKNGGKKKKKPKKSKWLCPEIIIVFDDLSSELKNKNLVELLKGNRHFKTKIIISSQYMLDLLPESRKQMDYFLLYRGQSEEKLEVVYKDADLSIDYKTFTDVYNKAVEKKYAFLYVDTNEIDFRQNFTKKFMIDEE